MVRSILVFYRNLHEKAAGLLRESTLRPGAVSVDGLGIQERMEPCLINRPNGTDGYLLMCFWDPVVIRDRSGTNEHPSNRLILWHPGDTHIYGNESVAWNHSWIHLCGSDVAALLDRNPIPRNEAFSFSFPELIDDGLLGIYEELEGLWPADRVLIRNFVESLFRRILRALFNDPAKAPLSDRMHAVKRYIDTHYSQPFTLQDLAKIGRLSVSHLSAEFRASFGCAPIEYRTHLRLRLAQRFLKDTNLRISEIAVLVGYGDLYYFSKHFKAHYGASPREFRRHAVQSMTE
ncbi:MAG: helix-turn-helix transcriptional regulator [Pirellulales bacterium]|nr:helix-turn-helix transcriptional regulator [Pirellulales bacterium]